MSLEEIYTQIAGHHFPGGCDDCDAYQDMTKQAGLYVINIHHDDTCPYWLARHHSSRPKEGQ